MNIMVKENKIFICKKQMKNMLQPITAVSFKRKIAQQYATIEQYTAKTCFLPLNS